MEDYRNRSSSICSTSSSSSTNIASFVEYLSDRSDEDDSRGIDEPQRKRLRVSPVSSSLASSEPEVPSLNLTVNSCLNSLSWTQISYSDVYHQALDEVSLIVSQMKLPRSSRYLCSSCSLLSTLALWPFYTLTIATLLCCAVLFLTLPL
jgi:hypothetical protein